MNYRSILLLLALLVAAKTHAVDDKKSKPPEPNTPKCLSALTAAPTTAEVLPLIQPQILKDLPEALSGLNAILRRPERMKREEYLEFLVDNSKQLLWWSLLDGLQFEEKDPYVRAGVVSLGLRLSLKETVELLTTGVLSIGPRTFDVIRRSDLGLVPETKEGEVYIQFSAKSAMGLQGVFSNRAEPAPILYLARELPEVRKLTATSTAYHSLTKGRLVAWAIQAVISDSGADRQALHETLKPRSPLPTHKIIRSELARPTNKLPLWGLTLHVSETVPVLSLISVVNPPGIEELTSKSLLGTENASLTDWYYLFGSEVEVDCNTYVIQGIISGFHWEYNRGRKNSIVIKLILDDGSVRFIGTREIRQINILRYTPPAHKRGNLQISRSVFESPPVQDFLNREINVTRHFLVEGMESETP